MKGCPNYPKYDCEAFDGKFCTLIDAVDEPCHYEYKQIISKTRKEICEKLSKPKWMKKLIT